MDGSSALAAFALRLRALRDFAVRTAKAAVPRVLAALQKQVADGRDPGGTPWPKKKDGSAPLEHAADALSAQAVGETVVVTLKGHEVFHHHGTARVPQRRILPDSGELPEPIADALREAAEETFKKTMEGA